MEIIFTFYRNKSPMPTLGWLTRWDAHPPDTCEASALPELSLTLMAILSIAWWICGIPCWLVHRHSGAQALAPTVVAAQIPLLHGGTEAAKVGG